MRRAIAASSVLVRVGGRFLVRFVSVAVALTALAGAAVAARSKQAVVRVETIPAGALVSVRAVPEPEPEGMARTVAGLTPLTREFDFGRGGRLWLEIEKRGYTPSVVEIVPTSGAVTVELVPLGPRPDPGSDPVPATAVPPPRRVALVPPDLTVVLRGFSSEERSAPAAAALAAALASAIGDQLRGRCELVPLAAGDDLARPLAGLWRDTRSALELLDPVRLPYLAEAPHLETRSGREGAARLGERSAADAVLLLTGRQNVETGSMKGGKLGLAAAGTAASFASAQQAAFASGRSFFVYQVHLPSFAEGIALRAALVDSRSGELLWINQGVFAPLWAEHPEGVARAVADLLTGLPVDVPAASPSTLDKESP